MITVRTPRDEAFNYDECENLYNKYKDDIGDDNFNDVINRTYFFAFHIKKTNELIGCIYFYFKGHKRPKLYVSAFANRRHHKLNLECLRESLSWWTCDIVAYTEQKTAKLCLLRTGFEKVKDNLYIYRR